MKRYFLVTVCILFFDFVSFAQEVPHKLTFADIELSIDDDAAAIIKERMHKLTVNQKFFTGLQKKYLLHDAIITRVFAENNVPDDFKYLCIMESSINPIAVSSSNAVGYWQFKKESATELGLRVDELVDERKNIVSSTTAACKYLKRSNNSMNNWVYALQSFNVGLGGTQRSVDNSLYGAKKMTISSKTHEYVVKYLAYMLLFKNRSNDTAPQQTLLEYTEAQNMTLQDIAVKADLSIDELRPHNQWLKTDKVPLDKSYAVIIPVSVDKTALVTERLQLKNTPPPPNNVVVKSPTNTPAKPIKKKWWQRGFSKDEDQLNTTDVPVLLTINGIPAIQAKPGDNLHKLANLGGVRYKKFLKYNEMRSFDDIIPGRFYYLNTKKTEASVLYYSVQPNESLWDIAQKYGVTTQSIQEKNRMADGEALVMGRRLYMKHARPANETVLIDEVKLPEVKRDTVFQTKTLEIRDTVIRVDTVVKTYVVKEANIAVKPIDKNSSKIDTVSSTVLDTLSFQYHTVEQGQTLYYIHKKYNTPIDSIMKWNQLDDTHLKLGTQIKVVKKVLKLSPKPKVEVKDVTPTYLQHTVEPGETLYSISKKYKVTVTQILELNKLTDNALKIGMDLQIPK